MTRHNSEGHFRTTVMSVIGPGTLGAINLAGSIAGGTRTSAGETDRLRESSSQRDAEANLQALAAQSLDDVAQADQTADRDADGRMPLGFADRESPAEPAEFEDDDLPRGMRQRIRPKDAEGVRGRRLDLEA
jgi:hypothetical protein